MKKKIVYDMGLNIVATAIPIAVLQLFILPNMSVVMGDEKYGLIVTIIAMINVVPSTFGNVLNNIRLIYQNKYDELNIVGDFNFLVIALSILNVAIVIAFSIVYKSESNFYSFMLTIIMSIMWLAREYYIVSYRITINYLFVMINNLIMVLGYAIGYFMFVKTGYWQFVYILGLIVSLIFIIFTSDLWKENIKPTELCKEVSFQTILLLIASLLTRIITYADKLLIYPILGGGVVAIYYAATIFGKMVSMAIGPVSSVALTYLAKLKTKSTNVFKQSFWISTIICVLGYVVCILISRPVLTWLYPQYVDEAMKYIYITTATTVIYALSSIVNPFIMKFFDMKWQIVISGVSVVLYVASCLLLLHFWGLLGFCLGALLTNVVKLLVMLLIYYKSSANEMSETEKSIEER